MNEAVILIGSNIEPQQNIKKCLRLLAESVEITSLSQIWKSKAYGSSGPDFLNIAVRIQTNYRIEELKPDVIRKIEAQLRRVRTSDKNAPRTIDIDMVIYNDRVLDNELWEKVFMAVPISELEPSIIDPNSGSQLIDIAKKLKSSNYIELFIPPDGFFHD